MLSVDAGWFRDQTEQGMTGMQQLDDNSTVAVWGEKKSISRFRVSHDLPATSFQIRATTESILQYAS